MWTTIHIGFFWPPFCAWPNALHAVKIKTAAHLVNAKPLFLTHEFTRPEAF